MSAILIEDLDKCFDLCSRRGSESPDRNKIVGGCGTGMGVPTQGTLSASEVGSSIPRSLLVSDLVAEYRSLHY